MQVTAGPTMALFHSTDSILRDPMIVRYLEERRAPYDAYAFYFFSVEVGQLGIFQLAVQRVDWHYQEVGYILFHIVEEGLPDLTYTLTVGSGS